MAPYRVPFPGLFHHGVPSFALAHGDLMKLPVEETVMSISDMTPGRLPSTTAGRRRGHLRQRTHEHQNQRRAKLQAGHVDLDTTLSSATMTVPTKHGRERAGMAVGVASSSRKGEKRSTKHVV